MHLIPSFIAASVLLSPMAAALPSGTHGNNHHGAQHHARQAVGDVTSRLGQLEDTVDKLTNTLGSMVGNLVGDQVGDLVEEPLEVVGTVTEGVQGVAGDDKSGGLLDGLLGEDGLLGGLLGGSLKKRQVMVVPQSTTSGTTEADNESLLGSLLDLNGLLGGLLGSKSLSSRCVE